MTAAELDRRGAALRRQGRPAAAQACFEQALQQDPACVPAWVNLAAALLDQARPDAAEAAARRALSLAPGAADAHFNLGCAQLALGRHADALASFAAVPPGHPAAAGAALNGALAWRALGRPGQALACCDAGLAADPAAALAADLQLQRALALLELNRAAEADAAAQAVLQARPGEPLGFVLRGRALLCQGQAAAARQQIDLALAAQPALALAWHDRGHASLAAGALEEACADYGRAMALAPRTPWLAGQWLHTRLKCADWQQLDATVAQLDAGVQAGQPLATPFQLSLLPVPAATLRRAAELTLRQLVGHVRAEPLPPAPHPPRLRVAYVSADWHDHPTLDLMLPVFGQHDRTRFELIGVALAPPADLPTVRRAAACMAQFVDVHALGDDAAAARLRTLGLHLAVDLNVFTQGARPGLFARRIAPLQLSLLGYPGTTGGICHDYLVADTHVVPAHARAEMAEALLMLPDSYFPGHVHPPAGAPVPSRAGLGLPPQGFVFCCMNHPAKILPASFDVWMRLLRDVAGSVLWLRDPFGAAAPRLRHAAAARGVAPQRLVFAPQRPRAEYLAGLGAADLFVDTWPYNAHTTGLEALRAGLPVLTVAGHGFAGRVGTSLLHAAGLPELVAATPDDYAAQALRLAREPARLAALRARLATQRTRAALFDTPRYVRHLERGFEAVWQRHLDGHAPGDVQVVAMAPR